MTTSYHVRLEKEVFVFSAAHFITFNGDTCECLHGHNYQVFAEVFGPLDENQYVIDFIALRDTLRQITQRLDHQVLLPTEHPLIGVSPGDREVEVTFRERRWVFPREDCQLLPVANTTAERVGRYIGGQLLDALESRTGTRPERLRVGVDENGGQWAICELVGE